MEPDYSGLKLTELVFGEMTGHYGETKPYVLDLMTSPEEPCPPRPLVLFLHGGGFSPHADRHQWYIPKFARDLAARGWAVAAPDYPVYDTHEEFWDFGLEPACRKVSEAIDLSLKYLEERKAELSLDTSRLALIGGSAGGLGSFYYLSSHPGVFRVFINLWGSPWILPDLAGFPPTLSVHGKRDTSVFYDFERPVEEGLERLGIKHRLITLEKAKHTPMERYGEFMPYVLEYLEEGLRQ